MEILEYYKKYISYFLIVVLSTLLGTMLTGSFNMKIDSFFYLLLITIGISIFIGSILYVYDKYFGPKKRIKKLKTGIFTDFLKIGFKNERDFLIGKINGYNIIISYNWRNNEGLQSLYTIILFDPRINGIYLNDYLLDKWQQSISDKFNYWEYGNFFTEWPYTNDIPKLHSILKKIEKNTKLISSKGLKKIELEEWENEIKNNINKSNF